MSAIFRPPLAGREFFPPLPVVLAHRAGLIMRDEDLLLAWRGVPTEQIVEDNPDPRVNATRRRVRELREAGWR